MKNKIVKTFEEHSELNTSGDKNEQELINSIEDIIRNEVYLRNVPYMI